MAPNMTEQEGNAINDEQHAQETVGASKVPKFAKIGSGFFFNKKKQQLENTRLKSRERAFQV